MAEKQPLIVIKKINVQAAGAHGGSWKVAFADFMTALMAFFLLMWLLGSDAETKKNVSDHFSTPSIIEYNFSNFGAELTLEKLFLDLVNEPLKFFQAFITPVDHTPNFMAMGSKKIVLHVMADVLGDVASDVQVHSDEIVFEIPEKHLFITGTGRTSTGFVDIMEKINAITSGLEDTNIYIDSVVTQESVSGRSYRLAQQVAEERIDLVSGNIRARLEHESVDVMVKSQVLTGQRDKDGRPSQGVVRFRIRQKDVLSDGSKPRRMGELFGKKDESMDVYNNFVKQVSERKAKKAE